MTQTLRYANVVDVKEQDRAVAALLAVTPVLVGVATRAVEGLEMAYSGKDSKEGKGELEGVKVRFPRPFAWCSSTSG